MSEHEQAYLFHHVFLPPSLPQSDDSDASMDLAMLDAIIAALQSFRQEVGDQLSEQQVIPVLETLRNLRRVYDVRNGWIINESQLEVVLAGMCAKGGTVPLWVRAQNACLILSNLDGKHVDLDVFELSAQNTAVITTEGRLQRTFPAAALQLPIEQPTDLGVWSGIAHIVTKMSQQAAPNTKPKVKKAGQRHDEERDTTHPKLVTELLVASLLPLGKVAKVNTIRKNTRDDVLWQKARSPWRRSALWLLVRVVMQLQWTRLQAQHSEVSNLYKSFMLFFMAKRLQSACESVGSADMIHVMAAKVRRRFLKMGSTPFPGRGNVLQGLEDAGKALDWRQDDLYRRLACEIAQPTISKKNLDADRDHELGPLDQFIRACRSAHGAQAQSSFRSISSYPSILTAIPSDLPLLEDDEITTYKVHAYELWMEQRLQDWAIKSVAQIRTPGQIHDAMIRYHRIAHAHYAEDPEALSLMVLTLLELWVVCDRSAINHCPLLSEYQSGIPVDVLQCLLLPLYPQLVRLKEVERYISARNTKATYPADAVFLHFGTGSCFAVKFFETSQKHQDLLRTIQDRAMRDRQEKRQEWSRKQDEYHELINLAATLSCEFDTWSSSRYPYDPYTQHRSTCLRCHYTKRAAAIEIEVHEWPLSNDPEAAQHTIFELDVPEPFGAWREATIFVLADVLQLAYGGKEAPRVRLTLRDDRGLVGYFRDWARDHPHEARCRLLSQVKSHHGTHRRGKQFQTASVEDVCLRNGLQYRYFDAQADCFATARVDKDALVKELMYKLPTRSAMLQKYLVRPAREADGPPPNTVIANQHECPQYLKSDEFEALASMPLGHSLQWLNLLRQLAAPVIDFKRPETTLIILQCILQAGPPGDSTARASHLVCEDPVFTDALLHEASCTLDRLKQSWESADAIDALTNIALRVLTLSQHTDGDTIVERALDLLHQIRDTTYKWVRYLLAQGHEEQDHERRVMLRLKAVEIALLCVQTCCTDDCHLQQNLLSPETAAVFIECSILISDNHLSLKGSANLLIRFRERRWRQLSLRACPKLLMTIVDDTSACLDIALQRTWSEYTTDARWTAADGSMVDWLARPRSSTSSGVLHMNLLTGEFRVDGRRLTRLGPEFEDTTAYRLLFDRRVLDVVPSQRTAMQYSSQYRHHGHQLHFGTWPRRRDVQKYGPYIAAVAESQELIFLPSALVQDAFPDALLQNFVWWYNMQIDAVELRPIADPWQPSTASWFIERHDTGMTHSWRVRIGVNFLVNMHSNSMDSLYGMLDSLEQRRRITVTYCRNLSVVELELPDLQLTFLYRLLDSKMCSKQFPSHTVDLDQNINTLLGLRSKLVLRHSETGERMLLLPEGKDVEFVRDADHVKVTIIHDHESHYHTFQIDYFLGLLRDQGDLHSQLYLAYLHALTSHCVPDRFTGRTGMEQALMVLKSAGVMSHLQPSQADLDVLSRIAKLTPTREYYPANEKVMQKVGWSPALSSLAQSGEYSRVVKFICDWYRDCQLFTPESKLVFPKLEHRHTSLHMRDISRNAHFYGVADDSERGACPVADQVYAGRDRNQESAQAVRSYSLARTFLAPDHAVSIHLRDNGGQSLWQALKPPCIVKGLSKAPTINFDFDVSLLLEPLGRIREYWVGIHEQLARHRRVARGSDIQLLMWLTTMAFATEDLMLLITLADLATSTEAITISPPQNIAAFELEDGTSLAQKKVRTLIALHTETFQPRPRPYGVDHHAEANEQRRMHDAFNSDLSLAVGRVLDSFMSQGPCELLEKPEGGTIHKYINLDTLMPAARKLFRGVHHNKILLAYLGSIQQCLARRPRSTVQLTWSHTDCAHPTSILPRMKISARECFGSIVSDLEPGPEDVCHNLLQPIQVVESSGSALAELVNRVAERASSTIQIQYADRLRLSSDALGHTQSQQVMPRKDVAGFVILRAYRMRCAEAKERAYSRLCDALYGNIADLYKIPRSHATGMVQHFLRVTPRFFLAQLSAQQRCKLPEAWQSSIVHYATLVAQEQRAKRMLSLPSGSAELLRELTNPGRTNWAPHQHPDWACMEIESDLTFRERQVEVAYTMMHPTEQQSASMQLNMGEGKSSVIVPAVTVAMADKNRLVRVIAAKPQFRQMFSMLKVKLGGLLDRRIYQMPITRDLRLTINDVATIHRLLTDCRERRGVLLVQPEHLLSLKLMHLESLITGKAEIGRAIGDIQSFCGAHARDIVDESDEVFNVNSELIYTMGSQRAVEFSPYRWQCIQHVLMLTIEAARELRERDPQAVEIRACQTGGFPIIRLLRQSAVPQFHDRIARSICDHGFLHLPTSNLLPNMKEAIRRYITDRNVGSAIIEQVEGSASSTLWGERREMLLLLRGLLGTGVLSFALGSKRWRVDYGLDPSREPATSLAVPYRGKDSPSLRSQFSHPDVVLILTSLSHYYGGLSMDEMMLTYEHLLRSEQADEEYQQWVVTANGLPSEFRHLSGVNLKDRVQCEQSIFPILRFNKCVIDYFLSNIVFAKEMREFPSKLSSSGWDVGEQRAHPVTGFSGTIDLHRTLPTMVTFQDSDAQRHTDALVLENVLKTANNVIRMPPRRSDHTSDADYVLDLVCGLDSMPQVILDVGALIVDHDNEQLAMAWLQKVSPSSGIEAVVYVSHTDELLVLQRDGRAEPLQTSPYASNLAVCHVYLDEVHTRGIDLRLPDHYRALVTVGARVTKDRLIQACMRMRKLGHGQFVTFCVPDEIAEQIVNREGSTNPDHLTVSDVLLWSIAETHHDLRRSMPLWAQQGHRYDRQQSLHRRIRSLEGESLDAKNAAVFLEDDAPSLEQRYRAGYHALATTYETTPTLLTSAIEQRMSTYDLCAETTVDFYKEAIRELSPEIQKQVQVQRAPPAEAKPHRVDADLEYLIQQGSCPRSSRVIKPAFELVRHTTAAKAFESLHIPTELWMTRDFSNTVRLHPKNDCTDSFLRCVQWVLVTCSRGAQRPVKHIDCPLLIISPYEAQNLLPAIRRSNFASLHIYGCRPHLGFQQLDHLTLYCIPQHRPAAMPLPRAVTILNLFAGQLYLDSMQEYVRLCRFLRSLLAEPSGSLDSAVEMLSLSVSDTDRAVPINCLKSLQTFIAIRKRGLNIDRTHLGKILAGVLLTERDFLRDSV